MVSFFFFNDTPTTEIYTLSLHDALPIWSARRAAARAGARPRRRARPPARRPPGAPRPPGPGLRALRSPLPPQPDRSEEHTSELQSRQYLVCRLLLEKKKTKCEAADVQ